MTPEPPEPLVRPATASEDLAAAQGLARRDPVGLLAAAITNFRADLAAADGPAHDANAADRRLGALVLRIYVAIAEAHRRWPSEAYGMGYETTALDDFIDDLSAAAAQELGVLTQKPDQVAGPCTPPTEQ